MTKILVPMLGAILLAGCGSPFNTQTQSASGLTGTWNMINVQDRIGGTTSMCAETKVDIVSSASVVTIGSYSLVCGTGIDRYETHSEAWTFDVQGTKLFFKGLLAGEVGSNFVHTNIALNGGSFFISIDPDGTGFSYRQSIGQSFLTIARLISRLP